ncbi:MULTISPECIES: tRNA-uridine aminocarboxypropyltransferase [unclassified Duganella]|uniref:tRNA-uridine aminocarboxypropyltransferase n=1 Tax=unclassified Duganella TaxID=2636909 RepID=UPI001E5AA79B|nr:MULTISPECIES: tRNA-uridine aminocarboxypropyltransferase [unclassified Duganella]
MNTMPRRPQCATCLRPAATCICHWAAPVASTVEVLILQHPMEVDNAKGSARLLHLCLPGSRIEVGEQYDEAALCAMLGAGGRQPVLLYPDTPDERSLGIAAPPPFSAALAPARIQLLVLDATWRKSRKMLYLNPALQALPRLPLRATPPSHYLIRKAHAPDQLSTLEATCYALAQLEGDAQRYQRVIAAFDGFVAQQQAQAARGASAS